HELQVTSPTSQLARNNDAWITTNLKTQMHSDPNVPSSRIKVVTENGMVFMMGLVNKHQADQAVRHAPGEDG
ncbi:BON domain-containing protein, partial [Pseudomonas aeruginosa]|uniref:BON domain-containing protein n=1 Tax=Pseudomonas aeruginosa TaxID=287 RepID=UPI003F7D073D